MATSGMPKVSEITTEIRISARRRSVSASLPGRGASSRRRVSGRLIAAPITAGGPAPRAVMVATSPKWSRPRASARREALGDAYRVQGAGYPWQAAEHGDAFFGDHAPADALHLAADWPSRIGHDEDLRLLAFADLAEVTLAEIGD